MPNPDIARLAAEARATMKAQSQKGEHWYPSMLAWQLADAIDALVKERDIQTQRIVELRYQDSQRFGELARLKEENKKLRAALEWIAAHERDDQGLSEAMNEKARNALAPSKEEPK